MNGQSPARTYTRLLGYLRPWWKRVVILFICTTIFAAFSGISLTLIPPFLNIVFSTEPTPVEERDEDDNGSPLIPDGIESQIDGLRRQVTRIIYQGTPTERLARFCLIFLALMIVKNVFGYFGTYLTVFLEQSILKSIRDELYGKIQMLPMAFFDRQRTGHLISRITNDVTNLRGAVVGGLASIIRNGLMTVIAVAIIFYTSWQLSLLTLVLVPLNIILIAVISRKLRKGSMRAQDRMADMTSVLQETISGVRSPTSETLGIMASVVILWYGGRLVISQQLEPANLMMFIGAMLWVVTPIKNLSKLNNVVQEGIVCAQRIFVILDIKTEEEISGDEEIDAIREGITYEDVRFSYNEETPVLADVDLKIGRGEVVALVGASGAGKSTLADLLPRFYEPGSGRIMIDGRDISRMRISSLRALMGIVTQETILFNDTVFNNIAYGMSDCPLADVVTAARAANANEFIEAMTHGYDTVIGDRGIQLSGGQRQRLAIARALLKNPQILILDEATSSLDVESEALVQEAIDRLVRGRTTLVIAHRLSTIKNADRIVVLESGRIRQIGTHEELIGEEGIYRKLYSLQIRA